MLIRELIKDIQDIKGDLKLQVNTFPVVFGIKKAIYLSISLKIIFIISLFIPFLNSEYGIKYLLILISGIMIPFSYNIYLLILYPNHKTYKFVQTIIKFSTIAGILSIYLD